jgi:hypothetical protein
MESGNMSTVYIKQSVSFEKSQELKRDDQKNLKAGS